MSINEIREFLEMAKEMSNCMINVTEGKVKILMHDEEVFSAIVGANDFGIEEYKNDYQFVYFENGIEYTRWEAKREM